MSIISALNAQTGTQAPTNSFEAQLMLLEKRIDAGVKNGTITSDQADQITKAVDAMKQTLDNAGGEDKLQQPDKVDMNQMMRDIARMLSGQPQDNNSTAESDLFGTTSDGGLNLLV